MADIVFENVYKTYQMGEVRIDAVKEASFTVRDGAFVAVLGPSGAGKTTVLNLLGGMDRATAGRILVDGCDIVPLNDRKLNQYRRDEVGFVFQFYNLMPNLTALENVELARQVGRNALDPAETLERVGLGERMNNFPAQLSGGEQQRVAIARALCKNPGLLLCDEPTGALDSETGRMVLGLLRDVCYDTGKTVMIITHNAAIVPAAQSVIRMKSGRISEIIENAAPRPMEEIVW
ncbi:MAG: ABC transporter ATP-binding protein [Clostridia bacterium]|nr:ABC transporter ATP-binding protein [Clostridia bacterium]